MPVDVSHLSEVDKVGSGTSTPTVPASDTPSESNGTAYLPDPAVNYIVAHTEAIDWPFLRLVSCSRTLPYCYLQVWHM